MNFDRANRHMELAGSNVPDGQSSAGLNVQGTQIPVFPEFSSDSEDDEQGQVFINTQVQGRLDEAEESDRLRASLGQFRYNSNSQGTEPSPERKRAVQRPNVTIRKKSKSVSPQRKTSPTKSQSLLKRLSGKHSKVQDMIKCERKVARSQHKAKDGNSKGAKNKRQPAKKYGTYNADEWHHIHNLLLERFPHSKPSEVEDTCRHLCERDSAKSLWNESQGPIESDPEDLESLPPPVVADEKRVLVLSLSQIMDDDSHSDGEDIVVPDTTDEDDTIIPIPAPLRHTQVSLRKRDLSSDTPETIPESSPDDVIDLTQGPFKVVKSLISPVRQETDEKVQVPATRLPTLGATPCLAPNKEGTPLEPVTSSDRLVVRSPDQALENPRLSDRESENSSPENRSTAELEGCMFSARTPSPGTLESPWKSQSAKQLRECISSLGLKPARSKRQMLESLQQASQVLEIDPEQSSTLQEHNTREVYNYLTSLVRSSPMLLERVYTFQPIGCKELLTKLRDTNPFVDAIDEYTIRTWADDQGICLTMG